MTHGLFRRVFLALVALLLAVSSFSFQNGASVDPAGASELNDSHSGIGSNQPALAENPSSDSRRFRTAVDLVLVGVSVFDDSDRILTGLSKNDFELTEDKKPQELTYFSTEDTPISIGIILDSSGSMEDKLQEARLAIAQFFRVSNPDDEYFMITFGNSPKKISGFTRDTNSLLSKAAFIKPDGRTALLDAVYLGINEMKNARYRRKAIIIISDGGDNHSRYSMKDVKTLVRESDVQIYSLGVYEQDISLRARTPEEMNGPYLLADIAQTTGGREILVADSNGLPQIVESVGHELRSIYMLGYKPAEARHDGKWRRIQVRLNFPAERRPRFRLFHRSGYYAPAGDRFGGGSIN